MNRFYVDKRQIQGEWVRITGEDVRHITKVLRLSPGDPVVICDGDNTDYRGVIERSGKDEVKVRLGKAADTGTEAAVRLVLYQAIAKGAKMELIIQKGTELGVVAFVPVTTSRTVVRLEDGRDTMKKLKRWQRIAMEAAKQCGRGRIPEVRAPLDFDEALEDMVGYGLALLPHAGEGGAPIDTLPGGAGDYDSIAVMIGPEGGFSDDEVEKATKKGIGIVSMGPRTLRTETAGLVAAAILMYRFGDLGGRA